MYAAAPPESYHANNSKNTTEPIIKYSRQFTTWITSTHTHTHTHTDTHTTSPDSVSQRQGMARVALRQTGFLVTEFNAVTGFTSENKFVMTAHAALHVAQLVTGRRFAVVVLSVRRPQLSNTTVKCMSNIHSRVRGKLKFGSDSDKKSEPSKNFCADGFPTETACNPQLKLKVTK